MKPWEGDYAYYSMRAGSLSADLEYPDQIYGEDYYKLVLEVNQFTTTLEQEAAVDAKVKELLNGRLAGVKGKSEYERAKAVYDFVSTSMHYDNSDLCITMRTAACAKVRLPAWGLPCLSSGCLRSWGWRAR